MRRIGDQTTAALHNIQCTHKCVFICLYVCVGGIDFYTRNPKKYKIK